MPYPIFADGEWLWSQAPGATDLPVPSGIVRKATDGDWGFGRSWTDTADLVPSNVRVNRADRAERDLNLNVAGGVVRKVATEGDWGFGRVWHPTARVSKNVMGYRLPEPPLPTSENVGGPAESSSPVPAHPAPLPRHSPAEHPHHASHSNRNPFRLAPFVVSEFQHLLHRDSGGGDATSARHGGHGAGVRHADEAQLSDAGPPATHAPASAHPAMSAETLASGWEGAPVDQRFSDFYMQSKASFTAGVEESAIEAIHGIPHHHAGGGGDGLISGQLADMAASAEEELRRSRLRYRRRGGDDDGGGGGGLEGDEDSEVGSTNHVFLSEEEEREREYNQAEVFGCADLRQLLTWKREGCDASATGVYQPRSNAVNGPPQVAQVVALGIQDSMAGEHPLVAQGDAAPSVAHGASVHLRGGGNPLSAIPGRSRYEHDGCPAVCARAIEDYEPVIVSAGGEFGEIIVWTSLSSGARPLLLASVLPRGSVKWSTPFPIVSRRVGSIILSPTILNDEAHGELLLAFKWLPSDSEPPMTLMMTSRDGGVNWGLPVTLAENHNEWVGAGNAAATVLVTPTSVFLFPGKMGTVLDLNKPVTDLGSGHENTGGVVLPGWMRSNPAIITLEDKSVFAVFPAMRSMYLHQSRSPDGGKTWTRPGMTSLPRFAYGLRMALLRETNVIAAVFVNSVHPGGLDTQPAKGWPLSVALSLDHGATWPFVRDVEPGGVVDCSLMPRLPGQLGPSYSNVEIMATPAGFAVSYHYWRDTIKIVELPQSWVEHGGTVGVFKGSEHRGRVHLASDGLLESGSDMLDTSCPYVQGDLPT
eukprot:jgi/Mesvir1/13735/Mv11881-RA.1